MSNSEITNNGTSFLPDFNSVSAIRYRRWRHIQDFLTRYLMAIGGAGVIVAILLIAFYLLYVVAPMFSPAKMERIASYSIPGDNDTGTLFYAMEEQREVGLRITEDGHAIFFRAADGSGISTFDLMEGIDAKVTTFAHGDSAQGIFAFGLNDGRVLVAQHVYKVTFPEGTTRLITPVIEYPVEKTPVMLDPQKNSLINLAVESDGGKTTIAGVTEDNRLLLLNITAEKSFLGDEVEIKRTESEISLIGHKVSHLLIDKKQREMYVASEDGVISYFDISNKDNPVLVQKVNAVPDDVKITTMKFLSGGISVLVGDSRGQIAQWFPVRDDKNNYTFEFVRNFRKSTAPITTIVPEYYRKGFIAADDEGYIGLYHTTAHRVVYHKRLGENSWQQAAIAPRANAVLLQNSSGLLEYWHVENKHPEISWQSIWGKVWYESRQQPEHIWQSSSALSDFEPKFSLSPLTYGTLKAAFYAMLFSVPLAIFGAMYTAYFMAPRMRGYVKPTIEIMEALPTVILGFLAGLWFAPYVEKHLPGIFLILIFIPLSIVVAAYAWHRLPENIRNLVPEGWEAALLLPVITFAIWLGATLSIPVEEMFFGGNMPLWLTNEMGIPYEQRNSLVVGLAMGFAVIPTIFSISEDALYSVPKHLTTGSLALGATRWQTMVRVVLLTASPGIFSAVMIGLGRAVGETMIVVMATGNTAIMDLNMFQGFRALSANIAVEMPETEVNSTHYRILFLAALVLFMATFLVNTVAEIVRQRLRNKYSSI
jgi:phosphate transport system permease protein